MSLSRRPMLWTPGLSPPGCSGHWSSRSRCRRNREGRRRARPPARRLGASGEAQPVIRSVLTTTHHAAGYETGSRSMNDPVVEIVELDTPRLRLRRWREEDREPFAAMNADPAVMEFFVAPQSREASDASIDAWQADFARRGWSNWAAEELCSGRFIGFVGLSVPRRVLPFSPCVEVGWRLARAYWGQGYASEAARASLRFG